MELIYKDKKSEAEIFQFKPDCSLPSNLLKNNLLIYGNNYEALLLMLDNSRYKKKIDLIYIDPPFATNGVFTIGQDRTSTISGSKTDTVAYSDLLTGEKYLEFLRERLIVARELLSEQGSIYVHIDYKIGHYVKIIMDEIFGEKNFRNDITRIKCNPKNFSRKAYGNIKDLILFYSKSKSPIWNEPLVKYSEGDIEKLYKKRDEKGRAYTTVPLHAPGETVTGETGSMFKGQLPPKGRHWRCAPRELEKLDEAGLIEWSKNGVPRRKIFADEKKGKKMQDIWDFKDYQFPSYPTEKNLDLLQHIIKTSSNPQSTILDFFCGSGTTLVAAELLGRKWIGIDKSKEAIKVTQKKLFDMKFDLFSLAEYDYVELTKHNKATEKKYIPYVVGYQIL